jgi:replicative DNA helicase
LKNGKVSYNKNVSKLDLDYFEKVLCYKALSDSTYLASIADHIKPVFFKDKNISKVFTIISEFHEKRSKLPTITEVKSYLTTDELKDSFKELVTSFSDIDKNIDKDELYENTEQFIKEKAVYNTMLEIAGDITKGSIDTATMLNKFEKSCNINLVTDLGFDLYNDIEVLIDDLNNVQKSIPSTWAWLDDALNGGFMENGRALYVFAGETNIGKSIFLGNIATNIANQGKNVLLISLEMSELLYARRLCANVSKIPLKDLTYNTPSLRQAIREQKEGNKGRIFIKEFPPSTITPNQLKAFVKKITDQGINVDAIVLDYLNLLHSPIGSNSYERIKNVTEQVRAMSYVFNCPIISATQLNRSGFNTDNPDLATISESVGLAATADVIVSIYQNEEDRDLGIIRLGMMKNRYGPRGHTQPMRVDYSTLTISQAEETIEVGEDSAFNALSMLGS